MKPRLLDLFCGAGGCSVGYARAGFEVVGVDIEPQPNYPFEFHQLDALRVLQGRSDSWPFWGDRNFDAIHASPPCQAFSELRKMPHAKEHEDLLTPTRELLEATGLPYVIENVEGAPLRDPVRLCGSSLGLWAGGRELRRHRLFETNFPVMVPPCAHQRPNIGVYGDHARDRAARANLPKSLGFEAMGMDWADWRGLTQAVPPAYTEHIGQYLMAHLESQREVAA